MKRNALIVILALVGLGLGISLVAFKEKAAKERTEADSQITTYSNQVIEYQKNLDEVKAVNIALETNLMVTRAEFSNKLAAAEANLADTSATLTKAVNKAQAEAKAAAETAAAAAAAAAADIAQRDKKISDLELENQSLDKQAAELRSFITNLETMIAATQKKLNASEGDRKFLLKELDRLRAEKADLERKFNDVVVLRDQLRKLKDELAISKRLDWMRRGVYESKKGAELLRPARFVSVTNQHDLNVELRQNGPATIQPATSTNAPK